MKTSNLFEALERRSLFSFTVPNGFVEVSSASVDATKSNGQTIFTGLNPDADYFLAVTGTATIGNTWNASNGEQRQTDLVRYDSRYVSGQYDTGVSGGARLTFAGLSVTGGWGAYQSDHEYGTLVDVTGDTVITKFHDDPNQYSDNGGAFSLKLYRKLPIVSITADSPASTPEGDPAGTTFTVTRTTGTGALDARLKLRESMDDASVAHIGDDFTLTVDGESVTPADGLFTVSFKPGEMSKTITVLAKADALEEGDETVHLDVYDDDQSSSSAAKTYAVGSPASAEVAIEDVVQTVTLEPADSSDGTIREGQSGKAMFKVKRDSTVGAIDVAIRIDAQGGDGIAMPGSALTTAGVDYVIDGYGLGSNNDEVIVHFAEDVDQIDLTVSAKADADVEDDEAFTLRLYDGYGSPGYQIGEANGVEGTIEDLPSARIVKGEETAAEEDAANHVADFTIEMSGLDSSQSGDVYFEILTGNADDATPGMDYEALASNVVHVSGNIYIANVSGSDSQTEIIIQAIDDAVVESDEFVRIVLLEDLAQGNSVPAYITKEMEAAFKATVKDNDFIFTAAQIDFGGQGVLRDTGDQKRYDDAAGQEWDGADFFDHNGTVDANDTAYPVSYRRSIGNDKTYLSVKPTFWIKGSFDPNANWVIAGDDLGIEGHDEFEIPKTSLQITQTAGQGDDKTENDEWKIVATGPVNSKQALGDVIWYGDLQVQWSLEKRDGDEVVAGRNYGTTKTTLYVTGNMVTNAFHTALQVASRATGLKPPEVGDDAAAIFNKSAAIADAIYVEFTDRSVARVDGTKLTYWGDSTDESHGPSIESTTATLLRDADGRCGSWAQFFRYTLAVQGVGTVIAQPVVKNTAVMPVSAPPPNTVKELRAFDVGAATSAQNNQTPFHVFDDHWLAAFSAGGRFAYYDPSYGSEAIKSSTTAEAELIWEKRAVQSLRWLYVVSGADQTQTLVAGGGSNPTNNDGNDRVTDFKYDNLPIQ